MSKPLHEMKLDELEVLKLQTLSQLNVAAKDENGQHAVLSCAETLEEVVLLIMSKNTATV